MRWIAARVLGGEDATPEGERFMETYGVQGFPAVMALTADGALVVPDLLERRLKTAPELVAAMEAAEQEAERFRKIRDDLLAKGDPESLEELAKRYAARRSADRSVATYAKIAEQDPTPERYEALARWAGGLRRADAEREALDHLLATWPDHERRVTWRIARALVGIGTPTSASAAQAARAQRLEALEALRVEMASANDREGEAEVRMLLAHVLDDAGQREEAQEHLAWVGREAADTFFAPVAHLLLARQHMQASAFEAAREHATQALESAPAGNPVRLDARLVLADLDWNADDLASVLAHYRAIVEEAPDSPQADKARKDIPFIEEEMR